RSATPLRVSARRCALRSLYGRRQGGIQSGTCSHFFLFLWRQVGNLPSDGKLPTCRHRGTSMNGPELLRVIDMIHREKNIPKEHIFSGIEAAVQLATEKHYGDEQGILVTIDRISGQIQAQRGEEIIDPGLLGRIAA